MAAVSIQRSRGPEREAHARAMIRRWAASGSSKAAFCRAEELSPVTHEWMWVTTIPKTRAPAGTVIGVGHRRWAIENEGFNQISNRWQLDHVYRHDPVAIETLTLLGMLAANIGQAFYDRDLKPARRARTTLLHVVALIAAGIRSGETCRGASP